MRLAKIQKFLRENNIQYNIEENDGFGTIRIEDNKMNCRSIEEFAGNNGNSVKGILIFRRESSRVGGEELSNQQQVIDRLKRELDEQ